MLAVCLLIDSMPISSSSSSVASTSKPITIQPARIATLITRARGILHRTCRQRVTGQMPCPHPQGATAWTLLSRALRCGGASMHEQGNEERHAKWQQRVARKMGRTRGKGPDAAERHITANTHKHKCAPTHVHPCTQIHTCTHTYTHIIHTHTHTCAHARAPAHAKTYTHSNTHTTHGLPQARGSWCTCAVPLQGVDV